MKRGNYSTESEPEIVKEDDFFRRAGVNRDITDSFSSFLQSYQLQREASRILRLGTFSGDTIAHSLSSNGQYEMYRVSKMCGGKGEECEKCKSRPRLTWSYLQELGILSRTKDEENSETRTD